MMSSAMNTTTPYATQLIGPRVSCTVPLGLPVTVATDLRSTQYFCSTKTSSAGTSSDSEYTAPLTTSNSPVMAR